MRGRGNRIWIQFCALLAMSLIATACGGEGDSSDVAGTGGELDEVSVRLSWLPSPEQAPFFLGVEKGFFEEEGIDLQIEHGNGSAAAIQQTANEEDDFAYADGGALVAAIAEGAPVKAIAAIYRTSGGVINVPEDSTIQRPSDLEGKTFAGAAFDAFTILLPGLVRQDGGNPEEVRIIEMEGGAHYQALLRGRVDAATGTSEYFKIRAAREGIELRPILFADFGFRVVGYSLMTNQDMLENNPDLVQRFVTASLKSWEYAVDHIDEAVESMNDARPDYDNPTLEEEIRADWITLDLLNSPATATEPLGVMAEEDWARTIELLHENGVAKSAPSPDEVFTNEFVLNE